MQKTNTEDATTNALNRQNHSHHHGPGSISHPSFSKKNFKHSSDLNTNHSLLIFTIMGITLKMHLNVHTSSMMTRFGELLLFLKNCYLKTHILVPQYSSSVQYDMNTVRITIWCTCTWPQYMYMYAYVLYLLHYYMAIRACTIYHPLCVLRARSLRPTKWAVFLISVVCYWPFTHSQIGSTVMVQG